MKNRNVTSIALNYDDGHTQYLCPSLPVPSTTLALLRQSGPETEAAVWRFTFGLPDDSKPQFPTVPIYTPDQHDARTIAEAFEFILNEVNELLENKADMGLSEMITLAAARYQSSEH